jgi:short-subunit dehydrogenase
MLAKMMNKTILITGASGAIGGALARHYARTEVHLILHGRNSEALARIAEQCKQLGATVSTVNLELRDTAALQTWASELAAQQLPDLIIANAGMNNHIGADGYENWTDVEAVLDLNIKSTFALINALLPALVSRGSGQIALISSLAAWYGLPITPSYCASKAAMKVYGEALRGGLASKGVRVNVVLAGYVQSPMCEAMPGPKPFLWSADKAARYIARGLANNQARISFPFPLNLGTWFLAVLPAPLSQWLLQFLHYGADEC